jgi:hypothetical protein
MKSETRNPKTEGFGAPGAHSFLVPFISPSRVGPAGARFSDFEFRISNFSL